MNEIQKAALYPLKWDEINKSFPEPLVASPADEHGRGIKLEMTLDGDEPYLNGARIYLLWQHRVTRAQGCEPFQRQMGDTEFWYVFYPTAMTLARGTVDVQIMVELEDGSTISTKTFLVRVERVLIDGTTEGDGFDLFRDAIKKYEDGSELAHDAADAATDAAGLASTAAERADGSADAADAAAAGAVAAADAAQEATESAREAAEGAREAAGEVGAAVAGAESAIGEANAAAEEARTQAEFANAMGESARNNARDANTAARRAAEATTQALGAAERVDEAIASAAGAAEDARAAGDEVRESAERGDFNGADGVSCTHRWEGTTLIVTSASGTSSADLKGEPGPAGEGTNFVAVEPLRLADGRLSIELDDLCAMEF